MRHIFADESRINSARFQLFGSLWLPRDLQEDFRKRFWALWDKEFPTRRSELKWTKVSTGKLPTYKKFVDLFAESAQTDFRCVVLDRHTLDYQGFHDGDKDLGFYKFLYFFLSRNIEKDYLYRAIRDPYQIFLDRRRAELEEIGRLSKLKEVLNKRLSERCSESVSPCVRNVEAADSKESPEIQMADLLMGAVGYAWEGFQTGSAKLELIRYIQEVFGLQLGLETPYLTERVNIWKFRLLDPKKKGALLPTPQRG